MKPLRLTLLSILAAATLGGCSVAPPSAYTFDPTHPQAKPAVDAAQVAPLTNRVAQLQDELNALRARIADQTDARQRLPLYAQENRIHRELGPLQRELAQYASAR
jgi:outer membrane murein-binding lipoprotein Lpp